MTAPTKRWVIFIVYSFMIHVVRAGNKSRDVCEYLLMQWKFDYAQDVQLFKFCDKPYFNNLYAGGDREKCFILAGILEQINEWHSIHDMSDDFDICGVGDTTWYQEYKHEFRKRKMNRPLHISPKKWTEDLKLHDLTISFDVHSLYVSNIDEMLKEPQSLKLSLFTWNTEYYFPKVADIFALLEGNKAVTWTQEVCKSEALVLVFQEVKEGWIDSVHYDEMVRVLSNRLKATCGEDNGWINAPAPENIEMSGFWGTKTMFNGGRGRGVNSQVLLVFRRKNIDTMLFKVSTKGEKGGVLARISKRSSDARHAPVSALVVGVHLETNAKKRDEQVFKILSEAVRIQDPDALNNKRANLNFVKYEDTSSEEDESSAEDEVPFRTRDRKIDNYIDEHSLWTTRLGFMLKNYYKMGVHFLGDSNFRMKPEAFLPRDADIDADDESELRGNFAQSLVDLTCEKTDSLEKIVLGDSNLYPTNALIRMGASISQPYPKLPPTYPYIDQQPHNAHDWTRSMNGAANTKASGIVRAWSTARTMVEGSESGECSSRGETELRGSILEGMDMSLRKHEVFAMKGPLLNVGYLDRLYSLTFPLTAQALSLECVAMIPGGDHLPVLFSTETTFPVLEGSAAHQGPWEYVESYVEDENRRIADLDANDFPQLSQALKRATHQYLTTLLYTNGGVPEEEFQAHSDFSVEVDPLEENRVTSPRFRSRSRRQARGDFRAHGKPSDGVLKARA